MTTYHGGNRATTNAIRPLSATDFRSLVSGYLNAPVQLPHTRQAYHDMDEARQREVKNGPYICACEFKPGTTERCDANASRMVMVALDLDAPATSPPDSTTSEPQIPEYLREIHDHPDIAITTLSPWNAVIHTTASSTPERPRLRVLVDADFPAGKANLRRAVAIVCDRLGIPRQFKGSKESTVLSQPYFRPVRFKDDPDEWSPVLATTFGGGRITAADIEGMSDAPENRRYGMDGTLSPDDPAIGLDQLPVADVTLAEIVPALDAIDPDCEYMTWTTVVSALRHQFRREEDARDAYDAFDAWSSRGTKYQGERETWGKWRSFKPDTTGKRAVTLRSLFKLAREAGWNPAPVAESTRKGFERWVEAQTEYDSLSERFAKRLLSLPFLNPLITDTLLERVRKKLAVLGGMPVKLASVMKTLEAERRAKTAAERESSVPNWLRNYTYITTMGKWLHIHKGVEVAMTDTAFATKHAIAAGDASPLEIARRTAEVRMPDSTAYDPREDDFFQYKGTDYYNEYRRHLLPDDTGDVDITVAKGLIDGHLLLLCGEPWIAETLLYFIAHLVQHPGEKIRWLPIIQSGEGAGKTLLANLVGAAIGDANVKVLSPAVMQTGAWNDWAYGCQLVVIEELMIKGKSREEIANTYKEFITNNTIALTRKFENSKTVPNVANGIAFTNSHSPIHLSESNRRYMFIKSPLQTRQAIVDLTASGYYKPLNELLKRPGEIRKYLLSVKIPDDFPVDGPAPMTRFNRYLINESRNRASDAIHDALLAADDPRIMPDIVDADHAARRFERFLTNNHPVQHWLPEHGFEPWKDGERVRVHGERVQLWVRAGWDFDLDGDPAVVLEKRTEKETQA